MGMDNCISGNRWGISIDGHDVPFSGDDSGSRWYVHGWIEYCEG